MAFFYGGVKFQRINLPQKPKSLHGVLWGLITRVVVVVQRDLWTALTLTSVAFRLPVMDAARPEQVAHLLLSAVIMAASQRTANWSDQHHRTRLSRIPTFHATPLWWHGPAEANLTTLDTAPGLVARGDGGSWWQDIREEEQLKVTGKAELQHKRTTLLPTLKLHLYYGQILLPFLSMWACGCAYPGLNLHVNTS